MMPMVTKVSIVNISSLISWFKKVLKDLNNYFKVYTSIRVAKIIESQKTWNLRNIEKKT